MAGGGPEPAPDALLLDLGGVVFPSPVKSPELHQFRVVGKDTGE